MKRIKPLKSYDLKKFSQDEISFLKWNYQSGKFRLCTDLLNLYKENKLLSENIKTLHKVIEEWEYSHESALKLVEQWEWLYKRNDPGSSPSPKTHLQIIR